VSARRWLRAIVTAVAVWSGSAALMSGQTPGAPLDLVIVNGTVVDGTGRPGVRADVGVRQGRVVTVGRISPAAVRAAAERIDATGLVVAPGFIDVHTHADDIAEHPLAANFVQMGVTTIVAGNCGSSALDVGEALDEIRDRGAAVNYATLIGHNTVRAAVMGNADRLPTIEDMRRMKSLVFKAMADGAVGFSTGLQYIPGTYAKTNELVELARVASNEGGLYATHMRNEGTGLEDAIRESVRVADLSASRLEISHLKIDSPSRWGRTGAALALIDDARTRDIDVQADQYAYTAGSSSLSIRFPSWALEGDRAAVAARLNDPETWARIKREMADLLAERGFTDLSWATIATYRADPSVSGLTMKAVAERWLGSGSADAQLEAARRIQLAGGASMVYHFMSDADVAAIMRHPMVAIASDAGNITPGQGVPHPRGYGDNARVLATYVREQHVITLEEAIRKMTSLPAAHFRFADRGVLRAGAFADIVVFNPATIADRATYASPHASPTGIATVIVNGVVTVKAGVHTNARAGQVLSLAK
jgi:N-acyl-D-amino-acid deacylase